MPVDLWVEGETEYSVVPAATDQFFRVRPSEFLARGQRTGTRLQCQCGGRDPDLQIGDIETFCLGTYFSAMFQKHCKALSQFET